MRRLSWGKYGRVAAGDSVARGVGERMSAAEIAATIRNGKGRMPGFANLADDQFRRCCRT